MGKKFLAPFAKLFASFTATLLLSIPGTTEAVSTQPNLEKSPALEQSAIIEISDFILERSSDIDSTVLMGHGSHRSHVSHGSHRSHYSSRY